MLLYRVAMGNRISHSLTASKSLRSQAQQALRFFKRLKTVFKNQLAEVLLVELRKYAEGVPS